MAGQCKVDRREISRLIHLELTMQENITLGNWQSQALEERELEKAPHVPGTATVFGDIRDGFLVSIDADGYMLRIARSTAPS